MRLSNEVSGTWLAPIAALLYPLFLRSAYGSMQLMLASRSVIETFGSLVMYVLALAMAFAVPVTAWICASRLRRAAPFSSSSLIRYRITHLAFATPPLFTAIGVCTYLLGFGALDVVVWVVMWGLASLYWLRQRPPGLQSNGSGSWSRLRSIHGVAALVVLLLFMVGHIANHLFALWTPELHDRVQGYLERIYRGPITEPLLVLTLVLLVVLGIKLAWRHSRVPGDGFRTLQTLTGSYLAIYIMSHLTAVFVMARWVEGIPSDWAFASAAPEGVVKDPWSIRLIPHYSIAVVALMTHLSLGLRGVLLAHGVRSSTANSLVRGGAATGALVSVLITAALMGVHFGYH